MRGTKLSDKSRPKSPLVTKLWNDDEIIGRIWFQALHLFSGATFGVKEPFLRQVSSVMHKLHAVKYHLRNYERIEKAHYVRATRESKKKPEQTREAFELIFELDLRV